MNISVPKSRLGELAQDALAQCLSRYRALDPPEPKCEVKVTVLLGLQGSGILELAKNVWQFARDDSEEQWLHVCILGEEPNGEVDLLFLGEKVLKVSSSVPARPNQPVHVLVTICASVSAAAVCSALVRRGLMVCTVASCVQTSNLNDPYLPGLDQKLLSSSTQTDDVHAWPALLLDQCRKGWVTHVVVSSAPGPSESQKAQEAAFRSKLHTLNPLAVFLGGSGSGMLSLEPEALLDLISSSVFGTPEMEKARSEDLGTDWKSLNPLDYAPKLNRPEKGENSSLNFHQLWLSDVARLPDSQRLACGLKELFPRAKTSITGYAQELGVVSWSSHNPKKLTGIRRALDLAQRKIEAEKLRAEGMERIKHMLKKLSKHKSKSSTGQVTSLLGIFRCKPIRITFGKPQIIGMLFEASASVIRIQGVQDSAFLDAVGVKQDSALVLVSGKAVSSLAVEYVEKIFKASAPYLPESRQRRTRDSITNAEIRRIEDMHSDKPLPEGWFFDGTAFVDINGNRLLHRPDLEGFVEEFIDVENKRIIDMKKAST